MLRRLLPAGSEPAWRDPSGEVRLDSIYAPFAWIGHKISELETEAKVRVGYLTRLGAGQIAHSDTVIQEGDFLSVFMREDTAEAVHKIFESGPEEN